jgi:hypothetical protein
MIRMLAFSAILITALAALAGAPFWIIGVCAAVLFAVSFRENRKFVARFDKTIDHVLTMANWQSAGHAVIASGMAFAIGLASRWALSI